MFDWLFGSNKKKEVQQGPNGALYRMTANGNKSYLNYANRSNKLDAHINQLQSTGQPVPRALLNQASAARTEALRRGQF